VTDEADLLRAVFATPDDDLPRLVYADWLEEHGGTVPCPKCKGTRIERRGESVGREFSGFSMEYRSYDCPCGTGTVPDGRRERAEFIRCQVERAGQRPGEYCVIDGDDGDPTYDCDCRRCHLIRRERELLNDWWTKWMPEPVKAFCCTNVSEYIRDGLPTFTFRRGFVCKVECTIGEFLGETCGRCNGGLWIGEFDTSDRRCPAKCNKGRVGGCAAEFSAAQPVTTVTATDKEPYESGISLSWLWFEDDNGRAANETHYLPRVIFDLLYGYPIPAENFPRSHKEYPTRDAAVDALSAALVQRGRQLAGLTALPSLS